MAPIFRRAKPVVDSPVVRHDGSSGDDDPEKQTRATTSARPLPMDEEDANRELKFLKKVHRWDPNLDSNVIEDLSHAKAARDAGAEAELVHDFEQDSPYPEVRAAVRNYDEDMPVNTIRAWIIGFICLTIGCGMNMLFSLRNPSIIITSFVAQLVAYPLGYIWDLVMPKRLCPGRFNQKEHTLITVMANVAFSGNQGPAYSTDTIVAMKAFYHLDFGWGFQLVLTFASQMLGFCLAGMLRRYLVYPAAMIWPSTFVNTSLFYALHDHAATDPAKANGWKIGRYRYFLYVFAASFVWYWFPGWIFQALSAFAFVTWIAPRNVVVNQLFGYSTGLGILPVTFDWTVVTGFSLSPLMFPWHAIANTVSGVIIFFIMTAVGLHYSGWQWSAYLPMSTSDSYDNTGNPYNTSMILTPEYELDVNKYKEYSPLFLSTTFSLSYGMSFASILALITHVTLFHGQEIWTRSLAARDAEPDIHFRMMRKYNEAAGWWYGLAFLLMFALALVSVLAWPTHLDWWALIVALLIALVFSVPIGIVQAITNVQLGLNVITEFIIGYMLPGRPIAMMLFKTYGYITMLQCLSFAQDLKLGQYMKVPPRLLFVAQFAGTVWSCVVQVAVLNWAFGSIDGICDLHQPDHYSCPNARVFFNASVIWGLIGPQRIFNAGQIYNPLMYFFIAGAVGPLIFYVLARMFPRSWARYVNVPLIFGGSGMIPPATTINYTAWGIIGFIFNKFLRDRYRGWWSTYNYITSAALDTGLAICTILIFLTLQQTKAVAPQWWGNTVISDTLDANGTAIQAAVPSTTHFGPESW